MVTLQLLGRIDLTDPMGKEISSLLSQPKRVAVLTYLAIRGKDGYLRRDVLMAEFWPESDLPHARNALNQVLHALRTELGDGVVRARGKNEVGLNPDLLDCDVWAFTQALEEDRVEDALYLYQGPLMPGFHINEGGGFDRWLEAEREALREAAAGVAWALAHRFIQEGELVRAERTAQRALALVWTDEFPVRRFISALAEAGDRAAAVRFYERFRDRLQEDLELEPSPTTRQVAEAIRLGEIDFIGPGLGSAGLPIDPEVGIGTTDADGTYVPPQTFTRHLHSIGTGRSSHGASVGPAPDGAGEAPNRPPAVSGRRSLVPRPWWWAAAVAGLVPLLAFLKTVRSPDSITNLPEDRPFILLAGVEGSGGEEERDAVGFLLRMGLDMSQVVQTVPAPDVAQALALMEQGEDSPLDPASAREVGVRLGVSTVVIPRLDRMGDAYTLSVRLEDAATGRLRSATRRTSKDASRVVELVDSSILDLRRDLGEAMEFLDRREPLPQVLTGSLEALREFQLARKIGPGRVRMAIRHLQRAVAADTAFAMAWQLLASFYGNYANQPDSAEFARRQAERFRDRLTEARRSDLDLHRRIREDVALWDLALEEAEEAVLRDPRFLNNYSVYTAVPGGLPDSALNIRFRLEKEGAEKARQFNPDLLYEARCFINTHYMAAALDRMDEFYALLDSMDIVLPPDCGREVALFESLAAAEWDRADSLVQHGPGDWRWPTLVEVALLQMVPLRGRIGASYGVPSLSAPQTKALRPDSTRLTRIAPLLLQVAYGLPPEKNPGASDPGPEGSVALEDRSRNAVTDFVLHGVTESLAGDTLEARRVASRLRAMRDSATSLTFERAFAPWFTLIEVGPAFQRGDWPTVLETLAPMEARIHQPKIGHLPGDDYLLWWLMAEAEVQVGETRSAVRHLEAILERPRFRRDNWLIQGFIRPAARFKLAGLYRDLGETDWAREHHRIFLDTFTQPEPEFRWMVEEARNALDDPEASSGPLLPGLTGTN